MAINRATRFSGGAEIVAVTVLGGTGVQRHAYAKARRLGPGLAVKRLLRGERGRNRVGRRARTLHRTNRRRS